EGAAEPSVLDSTEITQPALFAVEYALACLWESWGVRPAFLLGHSVGEYVAACLAGVFSLEDGMRLVSERGRLMGSLAAGSMAAVAAGPEALQELVMGDGVTIAAVNGPHSTVVSGETRAVESLCEALGARGIRCKALSVSHAFHSPMMEPALGPFARAVE